MTSAKVWFLLRRIGTTWSSQAVIRTGGDELVAFDCTADTATVITKRRLIEIKNSVQHPLPFAGGDSLRKNDNAADHPYPIKGMSNTTLPGDDEPASTVAFFGLIAEGDHLQAIGLDGLYRIEKNGTAKITPLPAFKNIGGIRVSFALPHLILVLTDVNERHSVSGNVPIMVSR